MVKNIYFSLLLASAFTTGITRLWAMEQDNSNKTKPVLFAEKLSNRAIELEQQSYEKEKTVLEKDIDALQTTIARTKSNLENTEQLYLELEASSSTSSFIEKSIHILNGHHRMLEKKQKELATLNQKTETLIANLQLLCFSEYLG